MRITKKEKEIIKWINRLSFDGKNSFTLDWICERVHRNKELSRPENYKSSMATTLRNFAGKAQAHGLRLYRASGIGRGNEGKYEFAGNFSVLLKEEVK